MELTTNDYGEEYTTCGDLFPKIRCYLCFIFLFLEIKEPLFVHQTNKKGLIDFYRLKSWLRINKLNLNELNGKWVSTEFICCLGV